MYLYYLFIISTNIRVLCLCKVQDFHIKIYGKFKIVTLAYICFGMISQYVDDKYKLGIAHYEEST